MSSVDKHTQERHSALAGRCLAHRLQANEQAGILKVYGGPAALKVKH